MSKEQQRRLTRRRAQVAQLCSEGWTLTAIAKLFGVSQSSIVRDRRKNGTEVNAVEYRLIRRRAQVAQLCSEGWTVVAIAKYLGVSDRAISRDRGELGISGTWTPFTDDEKKLSKTLLAEGCSLAEVARTLGRNKDTVAKHFRGQGWTIHQTGQYNKLRHLRQQVLDD